VHKCFTKDDDFCPENRLENATLVYN